jgi:hypothetical protein
MRRIAGPSRVARGERRLPADARAADPGGLAGALKPGSPSVGDYFGRPGADPADRGLPHGRRPPASLLQPGALDHQRDGRTGGNRPVGDDRRHLPGRQLLPRHRGGPDRCPGVRPRDARRSGHGRHRHRRIPRARPRPDPAAPRLDRARRSHDRRVARLHRPARLTAAADPERLRLRRRHRRLCGPARLAARRNPRRQRPGPGRAADVIDPDLLALHHRRRPAPHPGVPVPTWASAGAAGRTTGATARARARSRRQEK